MNEAQKTTDFLFAKMKKLYPTFERPDEIDVSVWVDILDGYSQTDILDALKNYRKNVPYNTAPTPAKFKDYLPEKHVKAETAERKELPTAYHFWKQDGASGDLKYFFQDYERAFDLCINDYLREVIPAEEFARYSWQRRIKAALDNGVLNRMPEALQAVQPKPRFLSDNEYAAIHGKAPARTATLKRVQDDGEYKNTPEVGVLAAHWGI